MLFGIFKKMNPRNNVPTWNIYIHCIILGLISFFADLEQLSRVISLGNLLSYSVINGSCIALRHVKGDEERSDMDGFVWLFIFAAVVFGLGMGFHPPIYITIIGIFLLMIGFLRIFLAP